jgi:disulfide bond formation protein DsbB
MLTRPQQRIAYAAGFAVCAALVGYALYLQYGQGEDPCPLCIFQRVCYMGFGAVCLVAAAHGPARAGAWVYTVFLLLFSTTGAALAGRQVWLQHLPKDRLPQCGPPLDFMLERFPILQVIEKVLKGSGECAEVGWQFLGLSIAGWSLVWFILCSIAVVLLALNARPR